ncbi:MAG: hypothetical protein ABT940_12670 [Alphaproteobacteria bacterium]
MGKLAVWSTVRETWRAVRLHAGALSRLLWPWVLLQFLAFIATAASPLLLLLYQGHIHFVALITVLTLLLVVTYLPIGTTTIRQVIEGPQRSAPLGRREGWYLLTGILSGLVILAVLLPMFGLGYVLGLEPQTVSWLVFALVLLLVPSLNRLALSAVPAALGQSRVDLLGAWRRTRGNGLRVFACNLLALLPILVINIGLALVVPLLPKLLSGNGMLGVIILVALLRFLISLVSVVVMATSMATIHRRLTER